MGFASYNGGETQCSVGFQKTNRRYGETRKGGSVVFMCEESLVWLILGVILGWISCGLVAYAMGATFKVYSKKERDKEKGG